MTNLKNLKKLAESMGADASGCSTNLEALNVISVALGGEGDAMTNAEAIGNVAKVAAGAMEQNVEFGEIPQTVDPANLLASITELIFPASMAASTRVQGDFSSYTSLKKVVFSGKVTLYTETFGRHPSIEEVIFEQGGSFDESGTFDHCQKLRKIVGVWSPSEGAFYGCTALQEVVFGKPYTIELNAFCNCTSLESIYIPETISSIAYDDGGEAFCGCTNLKTITINKPENSIPGAPWGATNATVVWTG